jgi:hypothetical protein
MRTAVIRVNVDPAGSLTNDRLSEGVEALRARGFDIVAGPTHGPQDSNLELILTGDDAAALGEFALQTCADVFGTEPEPGVVTFISRGTDEDALGVVAAFGVSYTSLERVIEGDDEIVVLTLTPEALARTPESRLRTALEASLNCEVRIVKA